jgi:hypothetical protein
VKIAGDALHADADGRTRRATDTRQRREELMLDALAGLLAERPLRD